MEHASEVLAKIPLSIHELIKIFHQGLDPDAGLNR